MFYGLAEDSKDKQKICFVYYSLYYKMGFIRASYKKAVTKLILLDEIPLYDFFLSRQFFLSFWER